MLQAWSVCEISREAKSVPSQWPAERSVTSSGPLCEAAAAIYLCFWKVLECGARSDVKCSA